MARPAAVKIQVFERTDDYVIAVWRRLMLLVWRGQATAAGIDRSRILFRPWAESQPGGAAFLIVIPARPTGPPDDETRAAIERTESWPAGPFKGVATLIEAEGFIAASVRSLMIRLSSRRDRRRAPSFFRTVAETATWAAALLDDPVIASTELDEAIRLARSA